MTHVTCSVVLRGSRGELQARLLVDTGSAYTIVDRSIAEDIGLEFLNKFKKVVTASGQVLEGELAAVDIVIEDEEVPREVVLVVKLQENIRQALRRLGVADWGLVGITTLEKAGYFVDVREGRLTKPGLFTI